MFNSLSFLARRASRYWPVLATLSLGVVLATALLASGPLLVNTVVEFGLRRKLLNAETLSANLRLILSEPPDVSRYRALDTQVEALVQTRIGQALAEIVPTGSSRWLSPWPAGKALGDQRVNLRFHDAAGGSAESGRGGRVEFLGGDWPTTEWTTNERAAPPVVQALVGEPLAHAYELAIGDLLPLSLDAQAEQPDLLIQVSGIARPLDSKSPHWFGEYSPWRASSTATYSAQWGVLVSQETFFAVARSLFSPSKVDLTWNVLVDPGEITFDQMAQLQAALLSLSQDAETLRQGMRVETDLDSALDEFTAQAETIRAPLYFLTATIVLLALYYVTMAAALSTQQFQREFAILQSRGASGWQVFRTQLLEAVLMVGTAVLSGPVLALVFTRALSLFGPLADVAQPEWALRIPQASLVAAIIGSAGCLVSLLAPLPAALHRSIVAHHQSLARSARPPWWQRLYLDVFVLLAGLILIWRMRMYGSILGGSAGRQVDWLLLLSPLALLLGSATILLRVFPLLLSLGARLVSQGRGLPVTLAMWQAARNPTHIARLVLLLTLAMALGIFSSGLNAALDRNEADQSRHIAGSDLRLDHPAFGTAEELRSVPGVQAATTVWRGEGTLTFRTEGAYPSFHLLALDPDVFSEVAQFRNDYADQPMVELLEKVSANTSTAPLLVLPGHPSRLGLWVKATQDHYDPVNRKRVVAKIQTAEGELITFHLRHTKIEDRMDDGWYFFAGDIPTDQAPVSLHSLWFHDHVPWTGRFGTPRISDLTVVDSATGRATVIDSFRYPQSAWRLSGTEQWSSIHPQTTSPPEDPVPALVSPAFQAVTQVQLGDLIGAWVNSQPTQFRIVGTVDHFPTLYEEEMAGFLVTTFAPLLSHLNRVGEESINGNEVFLSTATATAAMEASAASDRGTVQQGNAVPAGLQSLLENSAQVWNAETIRRNIKSDPMALGLRSVTLFGYVLTTVLSLAGFGTHFYLSTRQRGATYAVLRALGLSPKQLYGTLMFEQILLILSGLALGTVLGLLLNRLTLPGLPLSLGGRPPVPPFLAETDWGAVGRIYLILAAAFVVSMGIATGFLWRIKLHRILRVDEE